MTPWGDVPIPQRLCRWSYRKDSTTEAPRHRELVEITLRFLIVLGTLPCVSVVESLRSFREVDAWTGPFGAKQPCYPIALARPPIVIGILCHMML
jgi:hypothetical protein